MKKALIISLLLALSLPSYANQKPKTPSNQATTETQAQAPTDGEQSEGEGENKAPTPPKDIPANPHDPANGTLLEGITPNDSELSKANTDLLAKNAELTRQVENLNTQVNVLVQERSGQLFIYGAMTALFGLVLGFILAKLTTRQRW